MKRALILLIGSTMACSSSGREEQAQASIAPLSYRVEAPSPESALSAVARAVELAASTVRGRLIRVDREGRTYPAAGVAVRLNHPKYGPSTFAYSGQDGMYYLVGIPPGTYTLEVWVSPQSMLPFQIQVVDRQFTDIAPIRIP